MAGAGTSAAKGAVAGAAVGTAIPVIGNIIGGAVGGAVGFVSSLFGSKKHYHLYFFDPVTFTWKFIMDGHPSQVKPVKVAYEKDGLVTAMIRNVGDKNPDGSLAPKDPPAGYGSGGAAAAGGSGPWILAGIAGAGLLAFVLLKRRK